MTRTQQELLELLKRVAAFLEENGITFYLFGGTAIGALRHRGFIPWDDDIDILVSRDDYYKLIDAAGSLPGDLEFDCFELDDNFAKPYGMFCKKTDTATSRSRMYWGGICMGTAIDVFLTDDVPEDKLEEYTKDLFLYQETMVDAWLYKADIARYSDEYFALMERREEIGKPALMSELKARLEQHSYEESDRRVVRCSGGSPVRKYKKEWIGEPLWCEFEGLRMPLQTKPEACLRMQYGYDWYMIPPPEKQDHHVQIQNYDVSYNNYYADLSRFIDWDKAAEVNRKRKLADIGRLDSWLAVDSFSSEMMANALLMRADLEKNKDGILAAYGRGDFGAVTGSLSGLTRNIKLFIKTGCGRGQIDEELLSVWIECLMRAGRFWDSVKVKRAFCSEDGANSNGAADRSEEGANSSGAASAEEKTGNQLAHTLGLLDKVTEMAVSRQDHMADDCLAALEAIDPEIRMEIPDCIAAAAWLGRQGLKTEDASGLMAACGSYLESFPENCDIIKVKADLLIEQGKITEGEELYEKVLAESRNGLDILEIKDYFAEKVIQ